MQQTNTSQKEKTASSSLPETESEAARGKSASVPQNLTGSREYNTPGWSVPAYQELRERLARQYGLEINANQQAASLVAGTDGIATSDSSLPIGGENRNGLETTNGKVSTTCSGETCSSSQGNPTTSSGQVSYPTLPSLPDGQTHIRDSSPAESLGIVSYPRLPSR